MDSDLVLKKDNIEGLLKASDYHFYSGETYIVTYIPAALKHDINGKPADFVYNCAYGPHLDMGNLSLALTAIVDYLKVMPDNSRPLVLADTSGMHTDVSFREVSKLQILWQQIVRTDAYFCLYSPSTAHLFMGQVAATIGGRSNKLKLAGTDQTLDSVLQEIAGKLNSALDSNVLKTITSIQKIAVS